MKTTILAHWDKPLRALSLCIWRYIKYCTKNVYYCYYYWDTSVKVLTTPSCNLTTLQNTVVVRRSTAADTYNIVYALTYLEAEDGTQYSYPLRCLCRCVPVSFHPINHWQPYAWEQFEKGNFVNSDMQFCSTLHLGSIV